MAVESPQSPPTGMPPALPPAPPPPAPSSLDERLRTRWAHLRRALTAAQLLCGVPAALGSWWIGTVVSGFLMLLRGIANPGTSFSAWPLSAFVANIAIAAVLWGILAWAAKGAYDSGRRWGWREMALTTLPLVVCEEDYARQILEVMETAPMLRWASPPPPRTLEQQLEFAACYHRAYQRLRFGPGRLDTGTIWRGSLGWFFGQRMCCFCGCASGCMIFSLSFVAPTLWVLGGYVYLYRLGVEAAFVEYFVTEGALGGRHPAREPSA